MAVSEGAPSPAGQGTADASLLQPVTAGLLAAVVGYASTFTVLLAGWAAVGATPAQASSGLMTVCIAQGVLGMVVSVVTRQPISIVWSTPGSALLLATGALPGGFPTAVGATVLAGALITLCGIWQPFGRLVGAIPRSLAGALLAGVLFEICLAPVTAAHGAPALVLPVVVAWLLALRFARRWATPVAVVVAAAIIAGVTRLPASFGSASWPVLVPATPVFRWDAVLTLALPLFVVTMASQNIPGLAVLRANGYRPDFGRILLVTGLGGIGSAFGSGGLLNLAAITAALCASPDAHPDPQRRWVASFAAGALYVPLGLFSPAAAAFITAAPPSMIQAVAGLALMGSFGGALAGALLAERDRLAVAVTFVVVASGVSFLGVGSALWGLLAGGAVLLAEPRVR